MDTWVMYAIDTLFVIATVTPPLSVTIYRWKAVPLRRAEIEDMMKLAFESQDEAVRKEAQEALENNPYISDPRKTFDHCHNPWRYVFPMFVLTALTVCSTYIAYSWVCSKLLEPIAPTLLPPVGIAALTGGYVWSVYQILARVRASELSPADLYEIDLGLLAAVPVGIAFSLITVELAGVRDFMAFAASAFPLRDVSRTVREYATHKILKSAQRSTARPAERHLGTAIDGLSDQTLVRLNELRITTVLDMAYCDPIKIMVQTGFPLPVIVDWMDQSIWALYAGDYKAKINTYGIRCSLDVCEFVDLHLRDKEGKKKEIIAGSDKEALDALSKAMGAQATLLQDLFFRIYHDPQVIILRKLWYPKGVPKELRA